MDRRGFTLLELMVVIIILGVLATLGVMQYQSAIEKSRGAEARQVIGQLRSQCAALYMQGGDTTDCIAGNLGIGADIPGATCAGTHFFRYSSTPSGTSPDVVFVATRCDGTAGDGKIPNAAAANTLTLSTEYDTGVDNWTSTGGY